MVPNNVAALLLVRLLSEADKLGSPEVVSPNVLVVMNQPSMSVSLLLFQKTGIILYDLTSLLTRFPCERGSSTHSFPAIEMANQMGVPKAGNTALLGAMAALDLITFVKDILLNTLENKLQIQARCGRKKSSHF
jgi:2-oxoisovalerate ferredoxin oxidoreductase beta subunit